MKLTLLWLKIKFNKTNNGTSSKFKFFKFRLDMFPQLKSPQSEVRCRVYEIPKMFNMPSGTCNVTRTRYSINVTFKKEMGTEAYNKHSQNILILGNTKKYHK